MTDDEYADVRTLLGERVPSPRRRVDVDEVIRRGRRSRRIRRADQALAVAAALAVVIAAGVLVSRPHESSSPVGPSPTAATVGPSPFGSVVYPLPMSDWTPGSNALQALLTGTLRLDAHGCVVVDGGRGVLTAVVWPRGTTGRRTAGGAVEILAPDGSVAAATGDRVAVGGGGAGSAADSDPCVSAYGDTFVVMQPPPYTAHRDTPKAVLDAVAYAGRNGSIRGPVEWVSTTWGGIGAHITASSGDPHMPMYVVQARGDFVLTRAPRPSGEPAPAGTVLLQFVPAAGVDRGPGGYEAWYAVTDLSVLGTVHVLYP